MLRTEMQGWILFFLRKLIACVLLLNNLAGFAQGEDRLWVFSKAVDYQNRSSLLSAPYQSLQWADGALVATPKCIFGIEKAGDSLAVSGAFQSLWKSGVSSDAIALFVRQQFNFDSGEFKNHYDVSEATPGCKKLGMDLFVSGDKLLFLYAGSIFYEYTRVPPGKKISPLEPGIDLGEMKVSKLPFDPERYYSECVNSLPRLKGVPKQTTRCAPRYNYYVVLSRGCDWLSGLIGSHAYRKNSPNKDTAPEDFDDPLSHNLHPVFLLFRPINGILLVRVDDLEGNNVRDPFAGAYLSIKDRKVVDQLTEGCTFDEQYVCSFNGKPIYRLLDSGVFKRLP